MAGNSQTALIVVTSADEANGGGLDAPLALGADGTMVGPFSEDPHIYSTRVG